MPTHLSIVRQIMMVPYGMFIAIKGLAIIRIKRGI